MVFDGGDILIKADEIGREDGSDFKINIILPSKAKETKAAFFMHGFSQHPKAYRKTLKKIAEESQIVIVAVETGSFLPKSSRKCGNETRTPNLSCKRQSLQTPCSASKWCKTAKNPLPNTFPRMCLLD
jgi:hypothetical protein